MTISTPPGPATGSPGLAATINTLLDRRDDGYVIQRDGQASGDLSLCKPLPVYTVSLAQLAEERLDRATATGWYSLVFDQEAIAIADIEPGDGPAGSLRTLIKGNVAGRLGEAVSLAAEIAAPRAESFEARVLNVPEIYVMSLWLTSSDAADIFIPVLESGRPSFDVRADEGFLPRAAQTARLRLNAPNNQP